MLILICFLINISGTNSQTETRNLEPVNDRKRRLNEQIDNYIIIEFNKEVTYEGGKFLYNVWNMGQTFTQDYNQYISYIINENKTIYPNQKFTAMKNTKIEIHFNRTFTSFENIFDRNYDKNFESLIFVDFCYFDTSPVTNFNSMFYYCKSLQTLYLSNFNTSSVTDMRFMFQGCELLKILDLSNFDTSKVTAMDSMFRECKSLKSLIISNFNFDSIQRNDYGTDFKTGDIFLWANSIEYIDIYNIRDTNGVLKSAIAKTSDTNLNTKINLNVCQRNNSDIINNHNAINKCYNIINDNLVCNNIQTTIPIIQTTIPQIQTTIPQIQTTIPKIQTTIPKIQTTIPQIQTTIPQIQTTIPQIQDNIPQIQATIPQIQTTNLLIQTISPEITNERILLILFGFNSFKLSSSTISFYVLFTKILNDIYSNLMKAHLLINYNEGIKEEKEIDCYLKKTNNIKITSYFCETEIKNSNVKQAQINPNFNFVNQNNITVVGSTPFARMFMNNLQYIDDKYDNLENSFVYILDHSVYNKYSIYKYNITGIIEQEPKSKLENKNINLMVNLESESEIAKESNCTIIKIKENSYTLNCKLNDNVKADLQSAISFINDEEILLVNFDNGNSTITKNNPYEKYFFSKTSPLKSGGIVAIILPIIFVLAAIIGIIIYLKNKKKHDKNESSSKTESTSNKIIYN